MTSMTTMGTTECMTAHSVQWSASLRRRHERAPPGQRTEAPAESGTPQSLPEKCFDFGYLSVVNLPGTLSKVHPQGNSTRNRGKSEILKFQAPI